MSSQLCSGTITCMCPQCAGRGMNSVKFNSNSVEHQLMNAKVEIARLKGALGSKVFEEILVERIKQDVKWGGSDHDDQHSFKDWWSFVNRFMGRAANWYGGKFNIDNPPSVVTINSLKKCRENLVKVVALILAQIESIDRSLEAKEGKE